VLSRYGLATLFDSRPFTAYAMLCMVPFIGGLVFIYLGHSNTAQLLFGANFDASALINNVWFLTFLGFEAWMGFILAVWGGPGMITKDFANNSVQLYLSRPLSRTEYLFGKVSVLGALLSCTTWIPALFLFFIHAELQGNGWLWQNLWMAGSIFLASILWIAVISLLSMAVSVWVRWRIAASALMFAVFFVLPILGFAMNQILRTEWGRLINLPYVTTVIWAHLFRLTAMNRHGGDLDAIPLWSAWASLLSVCAFCFWLLDRKLRAREVESS
jgi:ABC-type transport system involved in multi-copper enzyme maturation permease subunit